MWEDKTQNKLIIISAPSGTGKTTLRKRLIKKLKNKIEFSVSVTTRPKRKNETTQDYLFVTKEEFEKLIKANELLEWTFIYGNYYGTMKNQIDKILEKNKDVLLDLDVEGGKKIKQLYKDKAILILILPPSMEELKKRLKKRRSENEITFEERLNEATKQIEEGLKYYNYYVINSKLKDCINKIEAIITAEKYKINKK